MPGSGGKLKVAGDVRPVSRVDDSASYPWLLAFSGGKKPIHLRWVFTYKLRPDGNVERYKARLVAKGYTQQMGVDYFEVWAPTQVSGVKQSAP